MSVGVRASHAASQSARSRAWPWAALLLLLGCEPERPPAPSEDAPPRSAEAGEVGAEQAATWSPTETPAVLTLIAEGSIEISGKPYIQPHTTGLLFVTDSDLKISGNPGLNYAEAQILVREQMQISGNPDITGQILVENGTNLSTLVDENKISGNPNIIYNGVVGSSAFQVSSWRWIQ